MKNKTNKNSNTGYRESNNRKKATVRSTGLDENPTEKLKNGLRELLRKNIKINEVIAKIINEEPTEKQKKEIAKLQKQLGTDYKYDCKAEATYVEQLLKDKLK